jgi:L-lactate dehydrogenase complex protein LldF
VSAELPRATAERPTSHAFRANARAALGDAQLQRALGNMQRDFVDRRGRAVGALPEYDALKAEAKALKDHTLAHLDFYLARFAEQVEAAGGMVHWCETPEEARTTISAICRAANARVVSKGKSMVGEEIALNAHLEAAGFTPIETDLGEYIIQLRHEMPSHITAPAIHLSKDDVGELFAAHHGTPRKSDPRALIAEAREVLRPRYTQADVGITGANFLVAETGSTAIATNEGNGDLTQTLAKTHIVLASIEKVVPTLEDAMTILRLLARASSGQELTVYTTFSSGPKRAADPDGPAAFHVVLLDNGRSGLLGGAFAEMLRCIRCAACLNHCPVYKTIGGHAYGWVYPGPMGAVLTPLLIGLEQAAALPNASTFCGRCEVACPMGIPLPKLMRQWREVEHERKVSPARYRAGLALWAFMVKRPWAYGALAGLAVGLLARLSGGRGRFRRLPLARGWTSGRDFPAPEGASFQALWRAQARRAA